VAALKKAHFWYSSNSLLIRITYRFLKKLTSHIPLQHFYHFYHFYHLFILSGTQAVAEREIIVRNVSGFIYNRNCVTSVIVLISARGFVCLLACHSELMSSLSIASCNPVAPPLFSFIHIPLICHPDGDYVLFECTFYIMRHTWSVQECYKEKQVIEGLKQALKDVYWNVFDSRALLRIFLRELGLERGPLSLVIG
jgi:hypothetical protein